MGVMATPKIVLFYVFTPLADPEAVKLWQHTLAESLGLKGRVIVSKDGINATVGGDVFDVKQYVRATKSYAPFKKADIKWSNGQGDDFPRLSVKVRPELVTFGTPDEIKVTDDGVQGGGEHLKPGALHKLLDERGDDVVFFDGRNAMEAQIGKFRDAIVPDTNTTRDFIAEIESGKYDDLKNKPVVTYCTGGIRCEVLSVLMKNRGFEEVYQLDGGIVRYGETFGSSGYWDGSLYVFDKRMHVEFGENVESIGHCVSCEAKTPEFVNCANLACRKQYLRCASARTGGSSPTAPTASSRTPPPKQTTALRCTPPPRRSRADRVQRSRLFAAASISVHRKSKPAAVSVSGMTHRLLRTSSDSCRRTAMPISSSHRGAGTPTGMRTARRRAVMSRALSVTPGLEILIGPVRPLWVSMKRIARITSSKCTQLKRRRPCVAG
jgi:UPF0176 protein